MEHEFSPILWVFQYGTPKFRCLRIWSKKMRVSLIFSPFSPCPKIATGHWVISSSPWPRHLCGEIVNVCIRTARFSVTDQRSLVSRDHSWTFYKFVRSFWNWSLFQCLETCPDFNPLSRTNTSPVYWHRGVPVLIAIHILLFVGESPNELQYIFIYSSLIRGWH